MKETVLNTVVEGYLTAKRVRDVFEDCLFKDHEIVNGKPIVDPLVVQGIMRKFGFHPDRIKKHHPEIEMLFSNLSEKCSEGVSFLCFCYDKYNHLWTGSHPHVEQLVSLGLATGIAEYCAPMEMWAALPGGVPYIKVNFGDFMKLSQKEEIQIDNIEELKNVRDEEIKKDVIRVVKGKYAKPEVNIVQKEKKPKALPAKLIKVAKKKTSKKTSTLDVKKTKITTKAKVKANVKTKKRK